MGFWHSWKHVMSDQVKVKNSNFETIKSIKGTLKISTEQKKPVLQRKQELNSSETSCDKVER
jgi:hypothetical protein